MRVRYSRAARRDIFEIARYLAGYNIDAALTTVTRIEDACTGLADYPDRFARIPLHPAANLRRRPVGDYLIIYKVSEIIDIVRVVHGAVDLEPLLDELDKGE